MTDPTAPPSPADRLPAATRPGAVRLQVADLERSITFYRDVLGFEVAEVEGSGARLSAPGGGRVLVELRERAGADPVPRTGRLGLYHFALLLPTRADLGRALARLLLHGQRPGGADHLVSEALYLADPDGLGIELYADRPREGWRWRGSEVRMESLPLDLQGLVHRGAEAPAGLPAGTSVGHLHLHVGALGAGEAFYADALGLEPTARGYPGALFLSAGGYHHHLGINTWAGAGAAPPPPDEAQLLGWELVLPDPDAAEGAVRRLRAAGHEVERDGAGWRVADPWGTPLHLRVAP